MVMMLHTGVPGSGKTYLMVNKMIDSYFDWDKQSGEFVRKEKYRDLTIISNIESLSVEHKDLDLMMETRCRVLAEKKAHQENVDSRIEESVIDEYYWEFYAEKVRWFFDYEYQKRITEKLGGGIVYCLEEVQNYFDTKRFQRQKWARDVCYYFEKHRHMGHSVYMDTQHNSKIAADIRVLFETEIAAKPRTMSVSGEFRYNELSSGVKVNQLPIVCRPKKRIFACYQSMSHDETVKTKKPVLKLLGFIGVMGLVSFFVYSQMASRFSPDPAGSKNDPAPVASPVAASSPSHASSPAHASPPAHSEPAGVWEQVSWVRSGEKLKFYNKIDGVLQDSGFFPYKIRRSGRDYLAYFPVPQDEKKDRVF